MQSSIRTAKGEGIIYQVCVVGDSGDFCEDFRKAATISI